MSNVTLIDQLLAEQRDLSAVSRFSARHKDVQGHSLQPHYRDLIPLTAPRPGEQYAFDVDLDACSGCKGCVTACHSLNGLDDGESWRDVGLLVGEASWDRIPKTGRYQGREVIPLQTTVTTACHHCVEPGCMLGCPVLAYDKDPVTGIVRHLDDQCMGCSYCIMKCPYEVPKFSTKRGIVRKCDMCHGRLAEGEAPACVQACPNQAIRITNIVINSVAIEFRPRQPTLQNADNNRTGNPSANRWLVDAPDPSITLPTTQYRTNKSPVTLLAADHSTARPQPAHPPLAAMLVLSQLAAGSWILMAVKGWVMDGPSPVSALVATGLLAMGLGCSVAHLGQPLKSWRAFLGWRHSWLSREILTLNAFFGLAVAVTIVTWIFPGPWMRLMLMMVPPVGIAAVFASAMVYIDTRRTFWKSRFTLPRFFGTTLIAFAWLASVTGFPNQITGGLLLMAATLTKLAVEVSLLRYRDSSGPEASWELQHTAALQTGRLRPVFSLRLISGITGGVLLPFLQAVSQSPGLPFWMLSATLLVFGEFLERLMFFTTVQPRRMPGRLH